MSNLCWEISGPTADLFARQSNPFSCHINRQSAICRNRGTQWYMKGQEGQGVRARLKKLAIGGELCLWESASARSCPLVKGVILACAWIRLANDQRRALPFASPCCVDAGLNAASVTGTDKPRPGVDVEFKTRNRSIPMDL